MANTSNLSTSSDQYGHLHFTNQSDYIDYYFATEPMANTSDVSTSTDQCGHIDFANQSDFYDYYFSNVDYTTEAVIWIISAMLSFIIALVAIFGNITIIVTLMMKKNKMFSTAAFFTSLAVADLVATVTSPLADWLTQVWPEIWSEYIDCAIITNVRNCCKVISSFTLAVITVERTVSVCLPLKVKIICSKQRANLLILLIWISTCIYIMIIMFGLDVITVAGETYCSIDLFAFYFQNYTFPIIYFIIPFFFIFSGSLIIVYKLYKQSKKGLTAKRTRTQTVTLTLIIANIFFVLTKPPLIIFDRIQCRTAGLTNELIFTAFVHLDDLSYGVNFFIYYLSGALFRRDVKTLFRKVWKKVMCR